MKLKYCLLLLLCPIVSAAQPAAKPPQIGETIADVALDSMVNYAAPSARLSTFKDKTILLDFFATWCSSCRAHFGAMDSLQRAYGDRLQIILVSSRNTKDDVKRVQKMFDTYNKTHPLPLSMPAVVKDSTLLSLFPHKYIPHYIWLDSTRTIKGITGTEFINATIVEAMLQPSTNHHP